jgi:hypothetical protein
MRDPNDLHQYEFAGRLADERPGRFLRVELLLMVADGSADLESLVRRKGDGLEARIAEIPELVGEEEVERFAKAKRLISAMSERYLARQIGSTEYRAARDAALQSLGTRPRELCLRKLDATLPRDPTRSLPLARRVEIVAEVLRKEISVLERQNEQREAAERERVEYLYRNAATRAKPVAVEALPLRAYVAAMFCVLGIAVDVGGVIQAPFGGSPSSNQIVAAIVVGIISALIRGPLISGVVTRSSQWRSRAVFTLSALGIVTVVSALVMGTQMQKTSGEMVWIAVGVFAVIRLGWLAFWAVYLGTMRIQPKQTTPA